MLFRSRGSWPQGSISFGTDDWGIGNAILICLSVCLCIYVSMCLSDCLPTYLSMCLFFFVCLLACLFLCRFVCLFFSYFIILLLHLLLCLSNVFSYLSICPSVYVPINLLVYPLACLVSSNTSLPLRPSPSPIPYHHPLISNPPSLPPFLSSALTSSHQSDSP